jgi:hypothetical protein
MPGTAALLEPLEKTIRQEFIPALLRRDVSELERNVIALPARFGGLGIFKPAEECLFAHENSLRVSLPLVRLILEQESKLDPMGLSEAIKALRKAVDADVEKRHKENFEVLNGLASSELKLCLNLSCEKGASSWVTAAPNYDHETVLHKGDFVDAIYMRYGWNIPDLPTLCACGDSFSVQHSLDCLLGGYRTIQHNEVRDVLAQAMREAGHKWSQRSYRSQARRFSTVLPTKKTTREAI